MIFVYVWFWMAKLSLPEVQFHVYHKLEKYKTTRTTLAMWLNWLFTVQRTSFAKSLSAYIVWLCVWMGECVWSIVRSSKGLANSTHYKHASAFFNRGNTDHFSFICIMPTEPMHAHLGAFHLPWNLEFRAGNARNAKVTGSQFQIWKARTFPMLLACLAITNS